MPLNKKLELARKKLTQKRKAVQGRRELRRRRVELNKPKTKTGRAKATVKQAKEFGGEAKKLASEVTYGKVGGSDKNGGGVASDADSLTDIPGVGEKTAQNLRRRGYTTPQDVQQASVADLNAVPGVGDLRAQQLTGRVGEGSGGSEKPSKMDLIFGSDRKERELPDFSGGSGGGGSLPDFSDTGGKELPDFSGKKGDLPDFSSKGGKR